MAEKENPLELNFDLTTPVEPRQATAPMMALVKRLMTEHPSVAPPGTAFSAVQQWLDDLLGTEPIPPSSEHWMAPAQEPDSEFLDDRQFL